MWEAALSEGWLLLIFVMALVATAVAFSLYCVVQPDLQSNQGQQREQRVRLMPRGKLEHEQVEKGIGLSSTFKHQPVMSWLTVFVALRHKLIIGGTQSGKTTLNHYNAIERARTGELVYVADPDARPGMWPGCRVVGGGDDYTAIERLAVEVAEEVAHRRRLRAQGQRKFRRLTVVVCELQDVIRECASMRQLVGRYLIN